MPIYEYRCQGCGNANSFYLKNYQSSPPSQCQHCDGGDLQRIFSAFAYVKSEGDKMAQLDPKYYKMVDQAMSKSPKDTDPEHHLRNMVPFSQAKEKGEPYFKE